MTKAEILAKLDAELHEYKPFAIALQCLNEAREVVSRRRTPDADVVAHAAHALAIAQGIREGSK